MTGWTATWLVATREAVERVRSRAFIVSTVLTLVILGGLVTLTIVTAGGGPTRFEVAVAGNPGPGFANALDAAAAANDATVEVIPVADGAAARAGVEAGTVDAAVIAPHTIVVESRLGTPVEAILGAALHQTQFLERLHATGLPPEAIAGILSEGAVDVVQLTPPPDTEGEAVALIAVVLLFVVITMYGQWVLMGVLEEKTTKVVEQVLSSIGVRSLLAGKVIGIGALGLGQLMLIVAIGLVALQVTGAFEVPAGAYPAAAWSLLWFVLGFAFYAVLYAAAGALVSRTEEAQVASTPVVLIGVVSYLLAFTVVVTDPNATVSRVLSLVPPIAPIAFPARIGFEGVPVWEILTGVGVMVLAVVGVTRLAARIYAGALLAGGGRVKVRQAWKAAGELAAGR